MEITTQGKYFFKYVILDNFLSGNDMEYFTNQIDIESIPLTTIRQIIQLSITKDKNIKVEIGEDPILIERIKAIAKKYENFLYELISKLCPAKSKLIDYINYTLTVTHKDFKHSIHDDTPNKLLSVVVFLKPEENMGTILYPCPKYELCDGKIQSPTEASIIQWKPNRAFVFSRIDQKTWHSYQSNGKSNRFTLIINVCTNRSNEVMEIEKSKEFQESITWVS